MSKLHQVLLAPLVSEKSFSATARENSVVFWVQPSATKQDIKRAVESFFKVTVESVRTLNTRPKAVRFGRTAGYQKAKKKAYIKLADGQTLSLTETN